MEYADFVEKCVKEYKETENEFVYQLINPFCETIVGKKMSKAELEQILKKGMQKSIPLDRIKQATEEIQELLNQEVIIDNTTGEPTELTETGEGLCMALDIIHKLIESEEK